MSPEERFFRQVGERIRDLRVSRGLSQGEVARRIQSYQQNVARSEAGQNLTLDVIFRLARALDVEPVEFFRITPGNSRRARTGA